MCRAGSALRPFTSLWVPKARAGAPGAPNTTKPGFWILTVRPSTSR